MKFFRKETMRMTDYPGGTMGRMTDARVRQLQVQFHRFTPTKIFYIKVAGWICISLGKLLTDRDSRRSIYKDISIK